MFRLVFLMPCILLALAWPPAPSATKPKIFNMEKLNTTANEDDPCPSQDNQQFLYTSDKGGKSELYLASRKAAGEALLPERLVDELSTEGDVRSAFLLPKNRDGWEYLFFATQYHTGEKKNLDLYRVGRFNPKRPFQGYSAAAPIQAVCTEADEAYPWVSADGKELYFSRKTKDGWKLHRATGKEPLAFDKAEEVAIPAGYYHACLNKAATVMILQGPASESETRQALFFIKRRTTKDAWGEPKPLTSLNSDEGNLGTCSPALSFDTKFLYFASDRPGGKGGLDLYVVAINELNELK
jgi:hypothetical protein